MKKDELVIDVLYYTDWANLYVGVACKLSFIKASEYLRVTIECHSRLQTYSSNFHVSQNNKKSFDTIFLNALYELKVQVM